MRQRIEEKEPRRLKGGQSYAERGCQDEYKKRSTMTPRLPYVKWGGGERGEVNKKLHAMRLRLCKMEQILPARSSDYSTTAHAHMNSELIGRCVGHSEFSEI